MNLFSALRAKSAFVGFFAALSFSSGAFAVGNFPIAPDASMTPGALCNRPTEYRYAEHIAYCERNVSSSTKAAIIHQYDVSFGYSIEQMTRTDFKIDHFIPLCMGGANEVTNLWPQHKSVYEKTDQIEEKLCELMLLGDMKQDEAVANIRHVKFHLEEAAQLLNDLNERAAHAHH